MPIIIIIMITVPSIAPQNFTNISTTATTITFQWNDLTAREANGIVRNYTVTCTRDNSTYMVSKNSIVHNCFQ